MTKKPLPGFIFFRGFLLIYLLGASFLCIRAAEEKQSLAGTWEVRLDPKGIGFSQNWIAPQTHFGQTMRLPGTTDEAGLGSPLRMQSEISKEGLARLQRKNSYVGPVWYRRTIKIPEQWKGKRIVLFFERVIWESRVWLDGREIGRQDSLSTPHLFDLTEAATPGEHSLVVRVDNQELHDIGRSHAYIEDTQSIWNGIEGHIELSATPEVWIDDVCVNPDPTAPSAKVTLGNLTRKPGSAMLKAVVEGNGIKSDEIQIPVKWDSTGGNATVPLQGLKGLKSWSEFHPNLFRLNLNLENPQQGDDFRSFPFGLRKISHDGPSLLLNGNPIFLRGTHDGCSFPLTGHPPMDVEQWRKIFKIVKKWGLNHMRFHSYTPPEAAFQAADEEGIYLQAELPIWTGDLGKKGDENRETWVRDEALAILKAYGNHPSFILMSLGNELRGQYGYMQKLTGDLQKEDSRRLYTMTSNRLWVADAPEKSGEVGGPPRVDDYLVERALVRNGVKESLRGQGFFNGMPNTEIDFSKTLQGITLPLITHEIGQWNVFPNLAEIPKYTGVLRPLNLEAIRDDLRSNGLLNQAQDFTKASGKFSAELYKQELELALRSRPLSGYQLLDLHDYPGQGTAHIGLLDSFWDSKQIAEPAWFRESAAPIVPLLRMPKRVYRSGEMFNADLEFVNFSERPIPDVHPIWEISSATGTTIGSGTLTCITLPIGAGIKSGKISFPLPSFAGPTKALVRVTAPEAGARNSWNIWIVPSGPASDAKDVLVTGSLKEAERRLRDGGRVLYTPSKEAIRQRQETSFLPSFWSPVYFTNQPGTMGLLIQEKHPALADFPTDDHTDWQWWSILTPSPGAVVLDQVKIGKPIVQVIDSFARNQKLGLIFEAQVGSGHLVVCSADLSVSALEDPMRRQLRSSLVHYLDKPTSERLSKLSETELEILFREESVGGISSGGEWAKDLEPLPGKK